MLNKKYRVIASLFLVSVVILGLVQLIDVPGFLAEARNYVTAGVLLFWALVLLRFTAAVQDREFLEEIPLASLTTQTAFGLAVPALLHLLGFGVAVVSISWPLYLCITLGFLDKPMTKWLEGKQKQLLAS